MTGKIAVQFSRESFRWLGGTLERHSNRLHIPTVYANMKRIGTNKKPKVESTPMINMGLIIVCYNGETLYYKLTQTDMISLGKNHTHSEMIVESTWAKLNDLSNLFYSIGVGSK